jgi:argininosuccinate lyase
MWNFNQSLAYDKRMYAEDIRGSIAYAKALVKVGVYTPDECEEVVRGLEQVEHEWATGSVSARVKR